MPVFSESAYSHALFCELYAKYGITDFRIPSTREEGLSHLGYDVHALVNGDFYFLQLKVPRKPKGSLATVAPFAFEIDQGQYADLRTIASQHVYFVAPVFNTRPDLLAHFRALTIEDSSGAWPVASPRLVAIADFTVRHYLVYDQRNFWVFSDETFEASPVVTLPKILTAGGLRREKAEDALEFLRRLRSTVLPPGKTSAETLVDGDVFELVYSIAVRARELGIHLAWRPG